MIRTYSEKEIAQACDISLSKIVAELGYHVQPRGSYYTTKEMDSLQIYNDRTWCRHSRREQGGKVGGSVIDFLVAYGDMTFPEAVEWSLNRQGILSEKRVTEVKSVVRRSADKKKFVLPKPHTDNRRVFAYLMKQRYLSYATVEFFIQQGILYESSSHHNMVFLGRDKNGEIRFASMRGTYDPPPGGEQKPFKCDVEGNDKRYGVNLCREESKQVAVFEGCIDMLSFYEIEHGSQHLLTLGMVDEAPLDTFLSEHPEVNGILLALDHDEAGRMATERLTRKYRELGYEVHIYPFPRSVKDVNNYLEIKKVKKQSRQNL